MSADNFDNIMRLGTEGVPPLDRRKFIDAFHLSNKAAMFPGNPFPDPTSKGFAIGNEDGTATEYSFGDTPMNRATFAVKKRYGDDRMFMPIFMLRFMALQEILEHPECAKWITAGEGDSMEISEATIYAAAVAPMTEELQFDPATYFPLVEEIDQEADED